jgi:hypothetical protein
MNRRDFTKNITKLIQEMIFTGEEPVVDYCLRSAQEQNRLFKLELSKCDGYVRVSKHQRGLAMDIYLTHINSNGNVIVDFEWDETKSFKWHSRWVELGGIELISWDKGHFES